MDSSFGRTVVRSFAWSGGGLLLGQLLSWLATVQVVRLLTSADYGLIAMAGVLPGLFLLVADFGLSSATIQANDLNREQLRGMLSLVFLTNAAGCLITLAGAPLIAGFFQEPGLIPLVRVSAITFCLVALYTIPQAQLVRRLDFKTKTRIDVVAMVVGAGSSVALALAGAGVWALVAGTLVQHAARALGYNLVSPVGLLPGRISSALRPLAVFGFTVLGARLLFYLYGQLGILIGARILGKEIFGVYAVALALASLPLEKLLPIVTQVSFAAFSRIQADTERVRRNFLRSVHGVALLCFPAFLGLAAVAPDFVPVVLGERWASLVLPLQLLSLSLPLRALGALFPPALFGIGKPRVHLENMFASTLVMAIALYGGVHYGVVGLCFAWVLGFPFAFAFMLWRSLPNLGISVREIFAQLAFPAGSSLSMAVLVLGMGTLLPAGASPLRLIVLVMVGIVGYSTITVLFRQGLTRDLVSVLRA